MPTRNLTWTAGAASLEPNMRIWCNYPLDEPAARLLREETASHELLLQPSEDPVRDSANAAPEDAPILFGQPNPDALLANANVRWVQLSSAGYTRYDRDDLRAVFRERGATLTNSSHVFDEPCAQHLAAMMFALARRLPVCLGNQRGARRWLQGQAGDRQSRLLNGQTVFVYGFGAIARRLVEILAPLRMQVFGVRRSPRGDEGVPMLTETEADARLGEADHVVNILPHNDATRQFFGVGRFARLRPGARFYNVGRGATVDQTALAAALRDGPLATAYLDVTDPEPLPAGHELWDLPNCYITPHVAGSHAGEDERLVQHFLANLRAFDAGNPLADRVF